MRLAFPLALLDHSARDTIAGIASRLAAVIIGVGVNNDRRTIRIEQARWAVGQRDVRIEDMGSELAIGADKLVRHVSGMWALFGHVAVLVLSWLEMVAGGFESAGS